ncbi:MAG: phosphonate metabolism protein/1,5-bisphosphokinase (PRPP-forming) PhnN [Rhodospirillales bacterium]|nr:MAG: phosphonate metabolism protein/1,5-bisphosphokinase (PRPP-forming) PhnN [Rhodospirillales bacterium]
MTSAAPRFGIYFVPAPGSALARFGAGLLGRDIETGEAVSQFPLPGIGPRRQLQHTQAARHYGFHATLKAPFHLAPRANFDAIDTAVSRIAAATSPVLLPGLEVTAENDFVALRPVAPTPGVDALAALCVREFDGFRAPPSAEETERRRSARLSRRQEELLARWGYPYVLDEFRFHLTITDRIPIGQQIRWKQALAASGSDQFAMPLLIDALSIVSQPDTTMPFKVVRRHALMGARRSRGHCFLIVGPSGSGKDTLIEAMKLALASDGFHFPKRVITRPADGGSELHYCASRDDFRSLQDNGAFCLSWEAHGLCYGIPDTEVEHALASGRHVLINVSRAVIEQARHRFGPGVTIINVTAPVDVLAARLRERGRESAQDIARRLARAMESAPTGADVVEFVNDRPLGLACESLAEILKDRVSRGLRPPVARGVC